jgi:phosphoribosyl 1,2-cyclic phosphate phosphodiesterase
MASAQKKKMLITILGSGTSVGAPMIGMQHLPQFKNPKNVRMRASCLIEPFGRGGPAVLIDTSTDLRQQALRFFPQKNPRLDAILLTHSHADHLHGLDDIRPFNFYQNHALPLYAMPESIDAVRSRFPYIFMESQMGGGKPKLQLVEVFDKAFKLKEVHDSDLRKISVQPIPVRHGDQACLGFRMGPVAYVTDTSYIPEESLKRLQGLDLLILDCLRPKPHTTHLNVEQALDYAKRIGARKTVMTHMGFELEYEKFRKELPKGMVPAYDGMQFRV